MAQRSTEKRRSKEVFRRAPQETLSLYSPMASCIATQWYYAAHSDIACGSCMRIKYHCANGIISLLRWQKYHAEGNSAYHLSFLSAFEVF